MRAVSVGVIKAMEGGFGMRLIGTHSAPTLCNYTFRMNRVKCKYGTYNGPGADPNAWAPDYLLDNV